MGRKSTLNMSGKKSERGLQDMEPYGNGGNPQRTRIPTVTTGSTEGETLSGALSPVLLCQVRARNAVRGTKTRLPDRRRRSRKTCLERPGLSLAGFEVITVGRF